MDTLTRFNQQVLQCQDEAYTLAWYLLGDEAQAEAVTQAAVEAAFDCFAAGRDDCRRLILRQVVNLCRERTPAACNSSEPDVFYGLHFLPEPERQVLLLIDILGLGYPDAAWVMDCPIQETGRLLAQARRKMITQKEFASY